MSPQQSLDMVLDQAGQSVMEVQWRALAAAGLRSQALHVSSSNRPHVTLAGAAEIPAGVREMAAREVAGGLPVTMTTSGLAILGDGPTVTLAHPIKPDPVIAEGVRRVRDALGCRGELLWHLTVARRMPRTQVAHALQILDEHRAPTTITARAVRHWNPRSQELTEIMGEPTFGDDHWRTANVSTDCLWRAVLASTAEQWGKVSPLWHTRGLLDGALGGPGHRSGPKDTAMWRAGTVVGSWQIEALHNHQLRMRARSRLPGVARLAFTVIGVSSSCSRLHLRSSFHTDSMSGKLLWHSELPAHHKVFSMMADDVMNRTRH